jgi:AcrR family transcriptional regulator
MSRCYQPAVAVKKNFDPTHAPSLNDLPFARPKTDGRRRRSERSRELIVGAVLQLVEQGNLWPSAEQVAAAAGVGLRSVFRHFKDMDTLFQEINGLVEPRLLAVAQTPFVAKDPRGQVLELITRRSLAFEALWNILRASQLHAYTSETVRVSQGRLVAALRMLFLSRMPAGALEPVSIEAIDLLLSFESWARLRQEQKLPVQRARDVLSHAVDAILTADKTFSRR